MPSPNPAAVCHLVLRRHRHEVQRRGFRCARTAVARLWRRQRRRPSWRGQPSTPLRDPDRDPPSRWHRCYLSRPGREDLVLVLAQERPDLLGASLRPGVALPDRRALELGDDPARSQANRGRGARSGRPSSDELSRAHRHIPPAGQRKDHRRLPADVVMDYGGALTCATPAPGSTSTRTQRCTTSNQTPVAAAVPPASLTRTAPPDWQRITRGHDYEGTTVACRRPPPSRLRSVSPTSGAGASRCKSTDEPQQSPAGSGMPGSLSDLVLSDRGSSAVRARRMAHAIPLT